MAQPQQVNLTVSGEYLMKVPREVAVEKFRGYILETNAEVSALTFSNMKMQIESKNALVQMRESERSTRFNLSIQLRDVEYAAPGRAEQLVRALKVNVDVTLVRARDRRNTNIEEQATRVLNLLAKQLSAFPIDDDLKTRIIPVYEPDSDGR